MAPNHTHIAMIQTCRDHHEINTPGPIQEVRDCMDPMPTHPHTKVVHRREFSPLGGLGGIPGIGGQYLKAVRLMSSVFHRKKTHVPCPSSPPFKRMQAQCKELWLFGDMVSAVFQNWVNLPCTGPSSTCAHTLSIQRSCLVLRMWLSSAPVLPSFPSALAFFFFF